MSIERRFFGNADAIEVRAEGEGEPRIEGYGARFNEWSPVYGGPMFGFRERIAPTFFDDVIDGDVRGLFNHDPNFVLGRTTSGTMKLEKDSEGLRYLITAPKTQSVNDYVVEPIRRKDVTGSSFSFELCDEETDGKAGDRWERGVDGVWERTLLHAKRFHDIGPVTFPWYTTTDTSVAQRSLEAAIAAEAPVPPVEEPPAVEPEPEPVNDDDAVSELDVLRVKLAGAA